MLHRGFGCDREQRYKSQFERSFEISWELDCPIRDGCSTAICEIDLQPLRARQIRPLRLACA